MAHGPFDAKEPLCPHGCTTVIREFRTAPAARSEKTKASDRALEHLAQRFGLSDMSNRSGSVGATRRHKEMDFSPVWGKMPAGNAWNGSAEVAPTGGVLKQGGGASAAVQQIAIPGPRGKPPMQLNMQAKDAAVADLEKSLSGKVGPIPTFGDVAKTMHKPVPHPVGHEPGKASDLQDAIEKAA
jgi:hypothetical protein